MSKVTCKELHRQLIAVAFALVCSIAIGQTPGPVCLPDPSVTERFLPVELITGEPLPQDPILRLAEIDKTYPFTAYYPNGDAPLKSETSLKGPVDHQAAGGKAIKAYERSVPGATERMALTDNQQALGRVFDERIGMVSNEGKYPVGVWRQGETRHFNTVFHTPRGDRETLTSITIEALSCEFESIKGAYSIRWTMDGGRRGDYGYTFAPGRGLVKVIVYRRAGN